MQLRKHAIIVVDLEKLKLKKNDCQKWIELIDLQNIRY